MLGGSRIHSWPNLRDEPAWRGTIPPGAEEGSPPSRTGPAASASAARPHWPPGSPGSRSLHAKQTQIFRDILTGGLIFFWHKVARILIWSPLLRLKYLLPQVSFSVAEPDPEHFCQIEKKLILSI
jgi:hypothetical protein